MTRRPAILPADIVTTLDPAHCGCVLVAGSHGGLVAARYAARAAVRAAIFNDAGIGCEEAGVAGLAWLEQRGIAAAAVAHDSARIADAADSLACGRISRVNMQARACGVTAGIRLPNAFVVPAQAGTQRLSGEPNGLENPKTLGSRVRGNDDGGMHETHARQKRRLAESHPGRDESVGVLSRRTARAARPSRRAAAAAWASPARNCHRV